MSCSFKAQRNDPSLQISRTSFISQLTKLKPLRFAIAGGASFCVAELILAIGVLSMTGGSIQMKSGAYSSPALIVLNIIVAILSVATGFFINERITVHNQGEQVKRGPVNIGTRLFKFELVYALGNVISIVVQLLLLHYFSISPVIGNVGGAIAAYPVNYMVSMMLVWKVKLL